MTIKNAKELTPRQWYLFLKLYKKYFRTEVARGDRNYVYNRLVMYLTGGGYAESTLSNIKYGSITSYVALDYDVKEDGEVPVGFITGYETPAGVLQINDIYSTWTESRKVQISYLYQALIKGAKKDGMVRVQMTTNDFMPKRTDDLESLGFDMVLDKGTEAVYQSYIIKPTE